jgi:hypothetical protein
LVIKSPLKPTIVEKSYQKEGEPIGHEPGVVGNGLDSGLTDVGCVGIDAADGLQVSGVGVGVLHVKDEALVVGVEQDVRG